jgi:hypothetical protein
MTKRAVTLKNKAPRARPEPLSPGLHAAVIELRSGSSFRVRTLDGTRVTAELAGGVEVGLAEECLRTGRSVIAAAGPKGAVILGALQTSRSPVQEESGTVKISGKDVRIQAERGLRIEAGPAVLRVDRAGVLRIEGEQMVVDMGALVRFLSAKVELP